MNYANKQYHIPHSYQFSNSLIHPVREEENGTALVDGVGHSESKLPVGVERGEPALWIVVLLPQESRSKEVLVGHAHHHDGEGGVDQVEDGEVDAVDGVGARPCIEQLPPEQQRRIRLKQGYTVLRDTYTHRALWTAYTALCWHGFTHSYVAFATCDTILRFYLTLKSYHKFMCQQRSHKAKNIYGIYSAWVLSIILLASML